GIDIHRLRDEPLLLAAPPGRWPDDGDGPDGLAACRDDRWIAPHSDTALRTVLERACHAAGFTPQLDYASDDFTVIMALIQAGLGVSLIPHSIVEPLAADVRLYPVADLELTRTVSVAVRAGSRPDPAIDTLIGALRDTAT
ncbi:MAG TPA: LysR substrate-binding domain-containing protein, partial [Stackebrandtia sp.]|uniref:LysR substrate-binding domain-containing protein n=1 Tax=Stackebrandtia sp. TaxID=2023065 RepID=UPI002D4645BB